jgi:hypothetical protein
MISANYNLKDEASYSFNYNIPIGANSFVEFRIRMINRDGTYSYSRIIRITTKLPVKAGITIAPNPVRGKFQMTITSASDAQAKIIFLDMQGRQVSVMNEILKRAQIHLQLRSMKIGSLVYTTHFKNKPGNTYNSFCCFE